MEWGLLKMPAPLNVGEERVYTAEIKWASSRMAVKGGAKVGRAGGGLLSIGD